MTEQSYTAWLEGVKARLAEASDTTATFDDAVAAGLRLAMAAPTDLARAVVELEARDERLEAAWRLAYGAISAVVGGWRCDHCSGWADDWEAIQHAPDCPVGIVLGATAGEQ